MPAKTKNRLPWVLLAAGCDYVLLHLCMSVAIMASIAYAWLATGPDSALLWLKEETRYYFVYFTLLALIFPVVFYLSGFYRKPREQGLRRISMALLPGIMVGTLVFLACNFLLFRRELVARSTLLVFVLLAVGTLALSRALWMALRARVEIKPRQTAESKSDGKVLVIGGAGYIGSILVRKLLTQGRKVRVLDNLTYGDAALQDILDHPNLEILVGDCRNIQNVVGAVKGVDAIVHLAAIVGDPACEQDHVTALEVNYAATRMVIEIAKGNGVQRLIFASSCSVYGASDHIMTEQSSLQPVSLYAQTKIDSETALLESRTATFHPVILRLATVFGLSSRPRFDLVVNLLAAKACMGEPITIFNGEHWRPFIHVQDVSRAMMCMLEAPLAAVGGEVFNVGDSRMNYTLSDVAREIRTNFPHTQVEHVNNSDRRNYRVSFEKINSRLGFTCSHDLQFGIAEIQKAFAQGMVLDYKNSSYHNQKYLETFGQTAERNELDQRVMAAFAAAGRITRVAV
jgi:nucleoside-diphosphate-sugar epimerase